MHVSHFSADFFFNHNMYLLVLNEESWVFFIFTMKAYFIFKDS